MLAVNTLYLMHLHSMPPIRYTTALNAEKERKSVNLMRDRLIELIESARYWGSGTSAEIAEYLLANGVIVPPCKVGDTVYRIVKMSTGITSKIRAIRKKAETTGVIQPCEPTIK